MTKKTAITILNILIRKWNQRNIFPEANDKKKFHLNKVLVCICYLCLGSKKIS